METSPVGREHEPDCGAPPHWKEAGNLKIPVAALEMDALEAYRRAYKLKIAGDLKARVIGPGADSSISLEAGQGILRILKSRVRSEQEEKEMARVKASIAEISGKGRAITPIIFPMDISRSMETLLSDDGKVRFDLDGDGIPRLWPWVNGQTGILVWDPMGKGRVESGIQLFGAVTWWIMWENGFEPLGLLDDNGDGWLTGGELVGLAVWRDQNANGRSDPGEVVSVASVGIRKIAAHHDGMAGETLLHSRGIVFAGGQTVPMYDWVPVSIR